jgi:hypothetical protein
MIDFLISTEPSHSGILSRAGLRRMAHTLIKPRAARGVWSIGHGPLRKTMTAAPIMHAISKPIAT